MAVQQDKICEMYGSDEGEEVTVDHEWNSGLMCEDEEDTYAKSMNAGDGTQTWYEGENAGSVCLQAVVG